jgi:hypothetical protein
VLKLYTDSLRDCAESASLTVGTVRVGTTRRMTKMTKKAKEKASIKKSEMRAIFGDLIQRVADSEDRETLPDFLHECSVHAAILLASLTSDAVRDRLLKIFVKFLHENVAILSVERDRQQSERAAREGRLQ